MSKSRRTNRSFFFFCFHVCGLYRREGPRCCEHAGVCWTGFLPCAASHFQRAFNFYSRNHTDKSYDLNSFADFKSHGLCVTTRKSKVIPRVEVIKVRDDP